jgi:putative ABC transport system ATP-binding protein
LSVRLARLRKDYEEGGARHVILDDADATFEAGRFTVIAGKSGCGKSTLLNLLSGIDVPSGGDVWIGEAHLTGMGERERSLFRRDRIGIVFQFFNLIPTLSVLENVTLPGELAGRAGTAAALRMLERVGMKERAHATPDRLSGGEQQRVAIARALAHDPQLVLADEPTGNLDAETGAQVLDLLLEVTREAGKTLVMATHSLDVLPLADAAWVIRGGRLERV